MAKKSESMALIPKDVGEVQSLSTMLGKSPLVPHSLRGKPGDIAITIMTGMELGLPPMTALRLIHVVQGRPVMAAELIVACALKASDCEYFRCVETTDKVATYETKRKGDPAPVRHSFTIEDAKRAGLLNKDNWKKYPAAMLRARCKAALARDHYPDAAAGVYSADEAQDIDPRTTVDAAEDVQAIDAEFTEVAPKAPETGEEQGDLFGEPAPSNGSTDFEKLLEAVSGARDEDALRDLATTCGQYEGNQRTQLLEAWKTRRQELRGGHNA